MKSCPECGRMVARLEFHHDPPKSVIFKENGTQYFIDKDGQKKLVLVHKKNRKLCWKCHQKEDKSWGLERFDIKKKKRGKRRTWWKKPSLTKL